MRADSRGDGVVFRGLGGRRAAAGCGGWRRLAADAEDEEADGVWQSLPLLRLLRRRMRVLSEQRT